MASEQHLCADDCDHKAARNAHGAETDAEKGKDQIAADEAHEHHRERVDSGKIGLLLALFMRHARRKTHKERNFGKRIGDDDQRNKCAEKILEADGVQHDKHRFRETEPK